MPKMKKREPNREIGSDNSTILHNALKGAIQGDGLDLRSLLHNAGVQPTFMALVPIYAAILSYDLNGAIAEFESIPPHLQNEAFNTLVDQHEFLDLLLDRLEKSQASG